MRTGLFERIVSGPPFYTLNLPDTARSSRFPQLPDFHGKLALRQRIGTLYPFPEGTPNE